MEQAGSTEMGSDSDLPVLGEPFVVELANTRYETSSERIDVLDEPALAARWFAHQAQRFPVPTPALFTTALLADLRAVRDATRGMLSSEHGPGGAVETLNRAAARACGRVELSDDRAWSIRHHGPAADVLVAAVASAAIAFLADEGARRVRRCERPGCPMLFAASHRSRRFCHRTCAQRLRQARYYRSRHSTADPASGASA